MAENLKKYRLAVLLFIMILVVAALSMYIFTKVRKPMTPVKGVYVQSTEKCNQVVNSWF